MANCFIHLTNALLDFSSVMSSIGGIILAVVILLAMVTIHEFGHYIAGKILGFRINEFSVGFGPALFKKRNKKTGELFALRIIPLGGYCAFDGEDDAEDNVENEKKQNEPPMVAPSANSEAETAENTAENTAANSDEFFDNASPVVVSSETSAEEKPPVSEREEEYSEPKGKRFTDQPPWKRIIVLVAGATMNYLLALLLIIVMFASFGQPFYKVVARAAADGETQTEQTEQEQDPAEPAEPVEPVVPVDPDRALIAGDIILSIEGKNMYLITDYIDALGGRKAGDEVKVAVLRKNADGKSERKTLKLSLAVDTDFKNMSDTQKLLRTLGIDTGLMQTPVKQGFFETLGHSVVYSGKIGGVIFRSIGELCTGKTSISSLGGPVTTIKVTAEAAQNGFMSFLNISSFIGVNLAVFNLLPIPALDGSKVVFCIIEWIRKKPVNRKAEAIIHFVGLVALFAFAILVDILGALR